MDKRFTPQSITLTLYNRAATSYGVCWMTLQKGEPILEYTHADDVKFKNPTQISANAEECDGMTRNSAVIENAVPGKKYLWRVGDKSGVYSKADEFTAIDPDADEMCFIVCADTQDRRHNGKWWRAVWCDALEKYPDAALSLHAGDIVDNGDNQRMWQLMTEHNTHFFRSLPMLPITGNHDHWEETNGIFHNHFNISPPADRSENLVYYSVDVGPVHFTMLSSGDYSYTDRHGLRPAQIEWAKRDIASSDKKWKIVMIHTPLYSPGKWGSHPDLHTNSTYLREQLSSAFAELGVDLVITGHDHIFSESYPILSDGRADHNTSYIIKKVKGEFFRIAVDPKGPIHMLPGCGGNQHRCVINDMDETAAGYFRDIIDMPHGCVSYAAVRVTDEVLAVDFCINRASDGENVIHRRFGIKKS